MTDLRYILVDGKPVPEPDLLKWARSFERRWQLKSEVGEVQVSTVFLGLDHSFSGGTPILFETMIFGGDVDEYQVRYATMEEAVEGHKVAVDMVLAGVKPSEPGAPVEGYGMERRVIRLGERMAEKVIKLQDRKRSKVEAHKELNEAFDKILGICQALGLRSSYIGMTGYRTFLAGAIDRSNWRR